MLQLVIGAPPRGKDYFGQDTLIEDIWTNLPKNNILITAPRRFGKTGAMFKLKDEPREPYHSIYLSVEYINTASDFMVELIASLLRDRHFTRILHKLWDESKGIGRYIRSIPADVEIGSLKVTIREKTDVSKNWLSYGQHLISLLSSKNPAVLLMIDEFPVMIDNIQKRNKNETIQLLRWFRAARIAPNTTARFIIGGSINLVSTLDELGLVDTINDLYILKLRPFSLEIAERFIEEVFKSYRINLTNEVMQIIIELVGRPIPYFLAVLLSAIVNRQRAERKDVNPELVKEIFEDDLLEGATSVTFHHYYSRIEQYYVGDEARATIEILRTLSRVEIGSRQDTLYHIYLKSTSQTPSHNTNESFRRLMDKLKNDFYIEESEGQYRFYSIVLKKWWRNRFGYQSVE